MIAVALCECGCGKQAPIATNNSVGRVKGQQLRFVHGHNRRGTVGDQHQSWGGASVTYSANHHWVRRHKKRTGICQSCGVQPPSYAGKSIGTDLANVSGHYLRDVNDYVELCRQCHCAFDGKTAGRSVEVYGTGI